MNKLFLQYCTVGRLSHEVGWKYQTVVRALENKRKAKTVLNIRKRDKLKVSFKIHFSNIMFVFQVIRFLIHFFVSETHQEGGRES